MAIKALLIDGLNLIRRIYAAVPGDPNSAAHFDGFLNSTRGSLRRALENLQPTHAVFVLDAGGHTWRHDLYPDYKQDRPAMPVPLHQGLVEVQALVGDLGIRSIQLPGVEADDVLASIACKIAAHHGQAIILSTDKGLCQLAGACIRVRDHFRGVDLGENYVQNKFGVAAAQLGDLFALVGDRSLSVPGVKGIGIRTGADLLGQFETLEGIFANLDKLGLRVAAKLRESQPVAYLSRSLIQPKLDVEIGVNLHDLRL